MWPAILAFTDKHLKLTDQAASILYFFGGFISLFNPLIIGRFVQTNPLAFFLFEGSYISLSFVLFILLHFLIGKKFTFFN